MGVTNVGVAALPEPDDNQPQGRRASGITPTEIAAVDELCSILARVLMRVQAEQGQHNQGEGGEL